MPLHAVPGEEGRNPEGGVVIGYFLGGDWTDRIRYEPPVSKGFVLLPPDPRTSPRRVKKLNPSTLWRLDKTEEVVIQIGFISNRGGRNVKRIRTEESAIKNEMPAPIDEIFGGGGGGSKSKATKKSALPRRTIKSSRVKGTVSREAVKKAVIRFG